MSKRLPPIPPASRSAKSTGEPARAERREAAGERHIERNLDEQGRQGNIRQNTRNQGYQQDR